MQKYTKVVKAEKKANTKNDVLLYDSEYIKIKKVEDWTVLLESDSVCMIPILMSERKILVRNEYVPSYKYRDGGDYYLTAISGTIEKFEDVDETIRRELVEEAGVKLNETYKIDILGSLFKSKTGSSKFHYCIIPLYSNEYTDVYATTDGSRTEALSKTVKVDFSYINKLSPSDTITKLLLDEVKKFLNL